MDKVEVELLIKDVVEKVLGNNVYQHVMVNQWINSIQENILGQLVKFNKPLKYIVITTVMKNSNAGLHTASSCYWDRIADDDYIVHWQNDTVKCICKIYGICKYIGISSLSL